MELELAFKIIVILLLLTDATLDMLYVQKYGIEENKGKISDIIVDVIMILLTGWLGSGIVAILVLLTSVLRKYQRDFK